MRRGRGKGMGMDGRGRCVGSGMKKRINSGRPCIETRNTLSSSKETNLHTPYLNKSNVHIIREQKLENLRLKPEESAGNLNAIKKSINEAEKTANVPGIVAAINQKECTGCGICQDFCVTGALTVDEIAKVDTEKCSGCGTCVAECPNEAISLRKAGR